MQFSGSLTNRIFFATTVMVVMSIGLAIYVVNVAVTQRAEDELRRGLEDAATLVEHNRDLLFEQFAREARLIADLPKLKAAVAVNHPPTVRPIAEDYQAQIGSDVFVVTDASGGVLAQIGSVELPAGGVAQLPPVKTALTGSAAASFWPSQGGGRAGRHGSDLDRRVPARAARHAERRVQPGRATGDTIQAADGK